jgi:DNA polymerase
MSEDDPRAELGWIAAQARGLLELDRMLGVASVPVPTLAPRTQPIVARPAAAKPAVAPAASKVAPPTIVDEALAARRSANEAQLEALARRMAGCTKCRLSQGRTNLVFGQGDAAAELVFVGEGPGYNEDQQGLAFVGKAGELLTKMIDAMGVTRDEVFIANVVKCRPPENRTPAPDEMGTCLPFLQEQLSIIKPKVICALGKTAALGLGLIGPDDSLGRSRGRFHDWKGTPVMVTYHPAYLLRTPGDKRKAWEDLQQLFPHLSRRRG